MRGLTAHRPAGPGHSWRREAMGSFRAARTAGIVPARNAIPMTESEATAVIGGDPPYHAEAVAAVMEGRLDVAAAAAALLARPLRDE